MKYEDEYISIESLLEDDELSDIIQEGLFDKLI